MARPDKTGSSQQHTLGRRQLVRDAVAFGAAAVAGSLALPGQASAAEVSPDFTIDLDARPTPFPHYWERCIGADHAKQALRRDFQDQLVRVHRELGVQSWRSHCILSPDTSVYATSRPAGWSRNAYSFFNVDQIYDFAVDHGIHPYVELSAMPQDLARPGGQSIFYYGFLSSPPSSFGDWGRLIGAFVKHLVDRYGIDQVRGWPFEVWNEPNLSFWAGTAQEYNLLYRFAAEAIKGVDADIPVGGPATDGDGLSYLQSFLGYVTAHDVPIDFVSSHGYGNNKLSGKDGVADIFRPTRAVIPARLPYYVSETGCNYSNVSDELDTSYAAAFWVKAVSLCDKTTDILSLWCFSDIFEEQTQPSNPFSGSFGTLTIYNIPKPMYRAYQLLHHTGRQRLPVTGSHRAPTVGALAIARPGGLDVFLYNHAYPGGPPVQSETVTVTLRGHRHQGAASLTRIDAHHANPRRAWHELGSPEYPTERQIDTMQRASEVHPEPIQPAHHRPDHDGRRQADTFRIPLPAEGVAVLHLG